MEARNIISIISKLMSVSKIEKEEDHLSLLETKISKEIKDEINGIEMARNSFVISISRQLALEQIRNVN